MLAAVDATKAKEIAKRFDVEGYPTGKYVTVLTDLQVKTLFVKVSGNMRS